MKTFKVYTDPSHGWMAVTLKDLKDLGLESKISLFSYVSKSGKTVYLEEDRDMYLFCQAYAAKYGSEPSLVFKTTDKRSRIRNLSCFGNNVIGASV